MRSIRVTTVTAALLIAAVAAPLTATVKPHRPAPSSPICEPVLATAEAVWIAEKEIEVGELSGLLNGAFYLQYDDAGNGTIQPSSGPPNLVITTKSGKLEVWLHGDSTPREDGSWGRKLSALKVKGYGGYAGAAADLKLSGLFYPEKGGGYQLTGSICVPSTQGPRR